MSCAFPVLAAYRIPVYTRYFQETFGDSDLPSLTMWAIQNRSLCMVVPAAVTLVTVLILRYSRRLNFSVRIALVGLVINAGLYFLLNEGLNSPLRAILS
jgi:hypothetical protein